MKRQLYVVCSLCLVIAIGISCVPSLISNTSVQSQWIMTTASQPWQEMAAPSASEAQALDATLIEIRTEGLQQRIDGFGGAFNELGWEALQLVPEEQRQQVLTNLMSSETGCGFTFARLPMGANDYAADWYSFNETPGDYMMEEFSIERDRQRLIPYLHAAMRIQPDLQVWGSPWSPPSWMKTNSNYAGRAAQPERVPPQEGEAPRMMRPSFEDMTQEQIDSLRALFGSRQQANTETNLFIMDDKTLTAYGLYFSKFIEEYKKEGIDIYAVHVQNEPNSAQNFPSCTWTPEALNTLVKYIGEQFEKDHPDVEVWLGTIERGLESSVDPILSDPEAAKYITGVGFQWAGKDVIGYVNEAYPQYELMQTETECGNGSNDWAAAEYTFSLIKRYFNNGVNSYMYWNMILDETGESSWGWTQNSMISIDSRTGEVIYNPEFYLMKHFGYFIRPGAYKIATSDSEEDILAFCNPDGSVVVIMMNTEEVSKNVCLRVAGSDYNIELPSKSLHTIQLGAI